MLSNPLTDAAGTWTHHAPAAATAAVVTLAAVAANYVVVDEIIFSYDVTPVAGSLTVAVGGTTYLAVAVTDAGPAHIVFGRPIVAPANTAVVITLAAAGAACTGKVSVGSR